MVDTIRCAHFLGVVERGRTVSIGKDIDVRCWEDFQRCFECSANKLSGLIARDKESSVLNVVLYLGLSCGLGRRRILLKED